MRYGFVWEACKLAAGYLGDGANSVPPTRSSKGTRMKRNIVLALLGLVGFLTLSSTTSHAQGLGSIAGTVPDPTGAAIAGSANHRYPGWVPGLLVKPQATTRVIMSCHPLRPTRYTVVIKARGFSDARQSVTLLAEIFLDYAYRRLSIWRCGRKLGITETAGHAGGEPASPA